MSTFIPRYRTPAVAFVFAVFASSIVSAQSAVTRQPSITTHGQDPARRLEGTGCPVISRWLARGARGTDVATLQLLLWRNGFLSRDAVTGFFGPMTEMALKQYQRAQGLVSAGDPVSTGFGAAGPRTRQALARCAVKPSAQTTPRAAPSTPPPATAPTASGTTSSEIPSSHSDCKFAEQLVRHGQSIAAYLADMVDVAGSCQSTERMCRDGALLGDVRFIFLRCDVRDPQPASICSPLPAETRMAACDLGLVGQRTQTRTSSCPGPVWGEWTTTETSCRSQVPERLGPPRVLATRYRTPLGKTFDEPVVGIGSPTPGRSPLAFEWRSPQGWTSLPAHAYSGVGSYHLTTSTPANTIKAYVPEINFSAQLGAWQGRYQLYSAGFQTGLGERSISINVLPGNSTGEQYEPYSVATTPTRTYLALQRYLKSSSLPWSRGDGVPTGGDGHLCESYLVTSTASAPDTFTFKGAIANRQIYEEQLARSGLQSNDLPLYYACSPRCIALSGDELVCAVRGSADDDDGYRPLDPRAVFETQTFPSQNASRTLFDARLVAPGVYVPALTAGAFYKPKDTVPIPPFLLAISRDSGTTWSRSLPVSRGGVDTALAYDPTNDILVIAYGGLTYPRKGVEVIWSSDRGRTWSSPLQVSDAYTTGTVFVAHTGDRTFEIVYDALERYIEFDHAKRTQIDDGFQVESRTLRIPMADVSM